MRRWASKRLRISDLRDDAGRFSGDLPGPMVVILVDLIAHTFVGNVGKEKWRAAL